MENQILAATKRAIITPDERLGIARAYQSGKTFDEIKIMFGVSETSIRRILDENKIPYEIIRRAWTDDEKKRVERYEKLGWSVADIAKQLGRQERSVYAYLHNKSRRAIPSQGKRRHWTQSEKDKCRELYEQGKSVIDIAKALGRSSGSVESWLSDNIKDTVHARARAYRLDGTPVPVKKVEEKMKEEDISMKPSLAEQIENAKAKMIEESDLSVEEVHYKTIKGKMGTYRLSNNVFSFSVTSTITTKEDFGKLIDEMSKVYAML